MKRYIFPVLLLLLVNSACFFNKTTWDCDGTECFPSTDEYGGVYETRADCRLDCLNSGYDDDYSYDSNDSGSDDSNSGDNTSQGSGLGQVTFWTNQPEYDRVVSYIVFAGNSKRYVTGYYDDGPPQVCNSIGNANYTTKPGYRQYYIYDKNDNREGPYYVTVVEDQCTLVLVY